MPISPEKINDEALVRIRGLMKRFVPTGRGALEGIDAEVHSGAVTGLVRPDGAGKTTLIRILAGLLEPTEGEVRVLGYDPVKAFVDRKAGLLSGGMKQKLGLACAMVSEPELLLLDEPGVGVDPISRRELWRMVIKLADKVAYPEGR